MTDYLLDVNVLIALAWPHHVHHRSAHHWFGQRGRNRWATCPLTQTAFVRTSSNPKILPDAVSPREALEALKKIVGVPGHIFWPDDLSPTTMQAYESVALVGHRQVTDAYLLGLAQHHDGKLATFDNGISQLLTDPKARSRYVFIVPA